MNRSVSFDKHIVALTSLEILLHCLNTVKEKETYWQWVYISLHSAIQAYMVLALTGSHSLLTYKQKDMEKWLESHNNNKPIPDCHLDSFLNLYRKTKSGDFLFYSNSKIFVPSKTQDWSIKILNKLRNDFVHYKSAGLTLIMRDNPFRIVNDCIDFIEFLAFQSNNISWFDEYYKTETERFLSECRSIIKTYA